MTPANPITLAHRSDRSPVAPECALAPSGQLVLVGAAQLGLDGRAYAVASPEGRSPEPLLGPPSPSFAPHPADEGSGPETGTRGTRPLRGQLVFDLGDTAAVPQLSLWGRMRVMWASVMFDSRNSRCERQRRKGGDVTGYRDERGRHYHAGMYHCRTYGCPSCAVRRARDTSATLGVAGERHLAASRNHDVWMWSPTVPHRFTDEGAETIAKLYEADAFFKRSRTWRNFVEEWGIVGTVRVFDSTHGGANGMHPHFHEALYPTRAIAERTSAPTLDGAMYGSPQWLHVEQWHHAYKAGAVQPIVQPPQPLRDLSADERQTFLDGLTVGLHGAWVDACRKAGVTWPIGGSALKISGAENAAAYFTAWGLADEVGGTPLKARCHLRLLDAAAAGVDGAAGEYVALVDAMAGRQWVTGLGDLTLRYRVTKEDARAYVAELRRKRDVVTEPVPLVRELIWTVPAWLYPAALSLGWERVHQILDEADAGDIDPQTALLDELRVEMYRRKLLPPRGPP